MSRTPSRVGGVRGVGGAGGASRAARATEAVVLEGVARTYPGPPPVAALHPLYAGIGRGEYVAVMGPSGSGKSTLLNLVGLLDAPTAGRYLLDGVDLARLGDRARTALRGGRVAVVFQAFHLLDDRTVVDNVALPLLYRGVAPTERERRARVLLDRVGLAHRAEARPATLSGGERQRVAIARALVGEPELLLCDEPTGNLDQATAGAILDLLDDLRGGGLTTVLVTHDPAVARRADRVLVLRDGRLVTSGNSKGDHAADDPRPAPATPAADYGRLEDRLEPASTASDERPGVPGRCRWRDIATEATLSLAARPRRSVLTGLGVLVGVVALVATLGLAATAANQIDDRFDALAATEVVVEEVAASGFEADSSAGQSSRSDRVLPLDAEQRASRLAGVAAAGVVATATGLEPASAHWPDSPLAAARPLTVAAVSPGAFEVMAPIVSRGRLFDELHARMRVRVAVLGRGAATSLGIADVAARPTVFVGLVPFSVIGIVDDVERHPELLLSVMVPESAALDAFAGASWSRRLLVVTRAGAARQVAEQAAMAIRPDQPERLRVQAPPDPRSLRAEVGRDTAALFIGLGLVSVLAGMLGIAATMSVAVWQRAREIGIRRAVGARRLHIAGQFLAEGGMLGVVGGVLGTTVGVVVVVVVAAARSWTAVVEPAVLAAAPLLGLATGVVAAVLPARRAATIDVVEALRR